MCFVPVEGKKGCYHHVDSTFVLTADVTAEQLQCIAECLKIPKKKFAKWKPGRLVLANDSE
jgi:hypothetical protein